MTTQVRISYTKFVEKNTKDTFYNTFIRLVESRKTFVYWYQQRYDTNKTPNELNSYSTRTQTSFIDWCTKEAKSFCRIAEPKTKNVTITIKEEDD